MWSHTGGTFRIWLIWEIRVHFKPEKSQLSPLQWCGYRVIFCVDIKNFVVISTFSQIIFWDVSSQKFIYDIRSDTILKADKIYIFPKFENYSNWFETLLWTQIIIEGHH